MEDAFFSVTSYLQNLFISRFSTFPIFIIISLIALVFSVVGVLEVYIYIVVGRVTALYKRTREANLKDRIIAMLANVLVFSDNDDPDAVVSHFLPRFSRLPLYRGTIRRLLVSELLKSHSSFNGRVAEVIQELYLQLKLDRKARKSLSSRRWEERIEAIRELTEMSVKEESEKILKYTDDRNPYLRLEAQISFIRLCVESPFRFMGFVREPILDWHQIVLFEVITKTESMARPRFATWLNSKNDSVVSFCLKLIEYYQQFDAVPNLIYLINHYNPAIRGAAIDILGRMEAEVAESHLVGAYANQPQKIQLKIVNALGVIGSGKCISFLNSQVRSKDFAIRLSAMRAIKAHRHEGVELLNTLFNESVTQDREIINFVLNETIIA
jgi:hypothetical protein